MRKLLLRLLLAFMLINASFSFAEFNIETKISTQKQASYKKQVDSIYKNFDNKLSKLSEEKQIMNIQKVVVSIDKMLQKKISDENKFVLSYLNYLFKSKLESYNKVNESNEIEGNLFSTPGRTWQIHEVKLFDNIITTEGKKLVGLDISYENNLGYSYEFPGDFSVNLKFKDINGFEYIWENRDYIGTSIKPGIMKNGEVKRGWVFIEIDSNVNKGLLNVSFLKNGLEKKLYKNIEVPKIEKTLVENKEKTVDVGLNEKFQLDGIEYEIKKVWTSNDMGNSTYPKKPSYDSFLIVEYSYKNLSNKHDYSGDLSLKLGDYIYDESSTVTAFGNNHFGYYGGNSSKVIQGTKRDTYTGFDIRKDDLNNATLIFSGWANDDYKVFIPLGKLLNKANSIIGNQVGEKEVNRSEVNILSTDDRPIGTIEITAPNYSYSQEKNLVYEIITTNNIVTGYEYYKNLKTGKFETSYFNKITSGFLNLETKEIYTAYHRWKYEYIKEDLMTFSHSFIIRGADVYYKNDKIGIFYPNQLQIQKQSDIPQTQGCKDYWSDNTIDKVYYDKNSKFFNKILDKTSYNYNYIYFCSENDAIKAGYKKSLN